MRLPSFSKEEIAKNEPKNEHQKIIIINKTQSTQFFGKQIQDLSEEKITTSKGSYRVVKNIYAIPEFGFNAQHEIVDKRLGYIFIKDENLDELPKEAKAVVWDEKNSRFVIVTGFIKIIPISSNYLKDLEEKYKIKLSRFFKHIKTAFFNTGENDINKLIDLVEKLKADPKIKSSELILFEDMLNAI